MKTPEEIKAAVLKECGRRVDADDTTIIVGERPVWMYACNHLIDENGKLKLILVSTEKDIWEKGYTINSLGMNLHLWSGATDQEWAFAYRLLNIEARELKEKTELLAKYKDDLPEIVKYIKGDELHSEDTVSSIQERVQGLVELAEHCAKWFGGKTLGNTAITALNQWKGVPNG